MRYTETRSDMFDAVETARSTDNGRTWSEWTAVPCVFETDRGVRRVTPHVGFVDPDTDRLVTLVLEGTLPDDSPLDGMQHYFVGYRVSTDGGLTNVVDEQVIEKGDYGPDHPLACVWVGRNSVMSGSGPYFRSVSGKLVFPLQITPPDREQPGEVLSYHEALVLLGTWTDDLRIEWETSERVAIDPVRSTRGLIEPTIAEMPDGSLLMVMRGSNEGQPVPGYKWCVRSADGGYHWSNPEPWTYDDGEPFFSPSSISQFVMHSSGRCFWIGNVCETNPDGNSPRYPLVIGQVDPESKGLIRDSVTVIDDRQADEDDSLQLSNFHACEDRETGEIILHLTRFMVHDWSGDAMVHRLAV